MIFGRSMLIFREESENPHQNPPRIVKHQNSENLPPEKKSFIFLLLKIRGGFWCGFSDSLHFSESDSVLQPPLGEDFLNFLIFKIRGGFWCGFSDSSRKNNINRPKIIQNRPKIIPNQPKIIQNHTKITPFFCTLL